MKIKEAKVFVTGATGFIGSRLVESLIEDHSCEVYVLVRDFSKLSNICRYPVHIISGGLEDYKALREGARKADIVFNLASAMWGDRDYYYQLNVNALQVFLEICKEEGIHHFIHTSSISAYGCPQSGVIDENTPRQKGNGDYADSKIDGEKLAADFAKSEDLHVSIAQPTIVYGPYGKIWTTFRLDSLQKNKIILVNDGSGICNAVYVDDVISGLIAIASSEDSNGECFLLSGAEAPTWKDFFEYYAKMLGSAEFIPMNKEDALQHYKKQNEEASTIEQLKELLRDQELRHKIRDLPPIKIPYKIIKNFLPGQVSDRVIQQIVDHNKPQIHEEQLLEKDILTLLPEEIDLYSSRAPVSIEKVQRITDFEPRFSLAEGMKATEKWAKWARLI